MWLQVRPDWQPTPDSFARWTGFHFLQYRKSVDQYSQTRSRHHVSAERLCISALDNSYRNVGREHPFHNTVLPSAASIAFFNSFPVIFRNRWPHNLTIVYSFRFLPVHEQAPLLLSTTLHPSVRNLHFHDKAQARPSPAVVRIRHPRLKRSMDFAKFTSPALSVAHYLWLHLRHKAVQSTSVAGLQIF